MKQAIILVISMLLSVNVLSCKIGKNNVQDKIPLMILEKTGFITFDATIEGHPIKMVIDTACNGTTLDKKFIESLHLNTKREITADQIAQRNVKAWIAHVGNFRVGKVSYTGDLTFQDMSITIKSIKEQDGISIDGLLGSDYLRSWNAIIDYKNKELLLNIKK